MRSIIVVTPIKNESWILRRFLAVCSSFADMIVVADQHSTDNSREICREFGKVRLVDNASDQYDEASRQRLLLETARRIVPGERFILALDADEILTADSRGAASWRVVHSAAPGTVFYYEKADIGSPPSRCRRSNTYFPLGYIDDGSTHKGDIIHSTRVPLRDASPREEIHDIKFAHLAYVRSEEFWARQRLYSLVERLKRTKTLRQRLGYYSPRLQRALIQAQMSQTPLTWLMPWRNCGIDFESFATSDLNNYNREILGMMDKYGAEPFFYDDIWDVDWEDLRQRFSATGQSVYPQFRSPITRPGLRFRAVTSALVWLIWLRRHLPAIRRP